MPDFLFFCFCLFNKRIVPVGALDRTGNKGTFHQVEISCIFPKKVLSRNPETFSIAGYKKLICVHLKDFLFGIFPFQQKCLDQFFELGLIRFFFASKYVFCSLLRDGASTLNHFACLYVSNKRPEHCLEIKAPVIEKILVLCGDESLYENLGDIFVDYVFTVDFFKEGSNGCATVIIIDMTF